MPPREDVIALYLANKWSSGRKPDQLMAALAGSDHVIAAYDGDRLVGLANALSDGHLVVYYPHLLVHPEAHGKGIGRELMARMRARYPSIHQHILVSVPDAVEFYRRAGFSIAENHAPMWIYDGDDG